MKRSEEACCWGLLFTQGLLSCLEVDYLVTHYHIDGRGEWLLLMIFLGAIVLLTTVGHILGGDRDA